MNTPRPHQSLALIACLSLIALFTSATHAAKISGADSGVRPNIIYIMSDDHAAHFVTGAGLKILKTPNIDRIAKTGMTFNRAFCTNALCGPARAVVLTGKYSHINGFAKNSDAFNADQPTFPKLLQKAGYQTGIFGKWHLKTTPQGFDEFLVLPGQGKYYDPTFYSTASPTKQIQIKGYCTDIIADKTLEWLDNRDKNKPFMVMVHNKAPHGPWDPAERHRNLYNDITIPHPPTFDIKETPAQAMSKSHMIDMYDRMNRMKKPQPTSPLDDFGWKNWHYQWYSKDYMRTLQSVDDNVGRILDYLEQNNLVDNTLVIYTSDNGMFVGDRGLFDKRLMYEPALRLPLYIRYPKTTTPGSTTNALALNVDYAPTILDFAGVSIPSDMQGHSLKPVLAGNTPDDWRPYIYYHYYEQPSGHNIPKHYGVRNQRYKLFHHYTDTLDWEMYDLKTDPDETNNLYNNPKHAATQKRLEGMIQRSQRKLNIPADHTKSE